MPLVSVTRLRIRAIRFLPIFFLHALRASRQARAADGNLAVEVLNDAKRTFWTCSLWKDQNAMRAFMSSGAHGRSMKRLAYWCDEGSVVHWEQASDALPAWDIAHERMQRDGRPSRVEHPSPAHQAFQIARPRISQ